MSSTQAARQLSTPAHEAWHRTRIPRREPRLSRQRGIVAFFSILVLALTALICMAYFTSTSMGLAQTGNQVAACDARVAVEDGFAFMIYQIKLCDQATGSTHVTELFQKLVVQLADNLNNTPNLRSGTVTLVGNTLHVPDVSLGSRKSFTATVQLVDSRTARLTVSGYATRDREVLRRRMSGDYKLSGGLPGPAALNYALTSAGPITMGNNSKLLGTNDSAATSIYSAYLGSDNTFTLSNGTVVPGGLWIKPGANVQAPANITIYELETPIDMPKFDPTFYKDPDYIGTTLTEMSEKNPSQSTYKNIIIKAGTNPTFGNDVKLQGVIYIESPNKVTFNNNCTLQGVMVADEAAPGTTPAENMVYFNNNMTVSRPDTLPDLPEFRQLRELPNVSVLMTDFTLQYKNNMNSFTGLIAVRDLIAGNNADVAFDGGLLVYGPQGVTIGNNMKMNVTLTEVTPLGFDGYVAKSSYGLKLSPGTITMD